MEDNLKYDKDLGMFTIAPDEKADQLDILDWVKKNPIETTAAGTAATLLTKKGRSAAGKVLTALGTPLAALGFAGLEIADRVSSKEELSPEEEALSNLSISTSLLFPEIAKRGGAKLGIGTLGRLASLGRIGTMFTPVGIGLTAASAGKYMYDFYKERKKELEAMEKEPDYVPPEYATDFEGGA
mgnify:CR=1 FL=1